MSVLPNPISCSRLRVKCSQVHILVKSSRSLTSCVTATSGGRTLACKKPENLENNCNRSPCVFCRNLHAGISPKKNPQPLAEKTASLLAPARHNAQTRRSRWRRKESCHHLEGWLGQPCPRVALPLGIALGAALGIRVSPRAFRRRARGILPVPGQPGSPRGGPPLWEECGLGEGARAPRLHREGKPTRTPRPGGSGSEGRPPARQTPPPTPGRGRRGPREPAGGRGGAYLPWASRMAACDSAGTWPPPPSPGLETWRAGTKMAAPPNFHCYFGHSSSYFLGARLPPATAAAPAPASVMAGAALRASAGARAGRGAPRRRGSAPGGGQAGRAALRGGAGPGPRGRSRSAGGARTAPAEATSAGGTCRHLCSASGPGVARAAAGGGWRLRRRGNLCISYGRRRRRRRHAPPMQTLSRGSSASGRGGGGGGGRGPGRGEGRGLCPGGARAGREGASAQREARGPAARGGESRARGRPEGGAPPLPPASPSPRRACSDARPTPSLPETPLLSLALSPLSRPAKESQNGTEKLRVASCPSGEKKKKEKQKNSVSLPVRRTGRYGIKDLRK